MASEQQFDELLYNGWPNCFKVSDLCICNGLVFLRVWTPVWWLGSSLMDFFKLSPFQMYYKEWDPWIVMLIIIELQAVRLKFLYIFHVLSSTWIALHFKVFNAFQIIIHFKWTCLSRGHFNRWKKVLHFYLQHVLTSWNTQFFIFILLCINMWL